MSKTEVYSWRLDPELKQRLEEAARAEETTISELLERVTRDWLGKCGREGKPLKGDAEQERRRARIIACAGSVAGDGVSATNKRVREVMGEIMDEKRARSRTR